MFLRPAALIRDMGYLPTTIKDSMTTIPADFPVDREGIIHPAYSGEDEGDHLPLESLIELSRQ